MLVLSPIGHAVVLGDALVVRERESLRLYVTACSCVSLIGHRVAAGSGVAAHGAINE